MSIDSPTGILDIRNATLKVSKLEVTNATGFDTALNNIARNTILLVDSTEQTASNSWALKLPNAWVGEFEGYWASGATGNIDFNFYNNTTSGTNGYTLSMDDTTIVVKYDGTTLQTTTISSTLKTDAYRKVSILFERDTISVSIDGVRELYFKDSTLRSRVYDDTAGGYITVGGLDATNRKFKNLKVVNEKWISDGTSNIACMGSIDVVGNLNLQKVSNTASIKLNSNVVTEYTRSKKSLIKYPRVAMTAATTAGYTASASSEQTSDRAAWKAFDNILYSSYHEPVFSTNPYPNADGAYTGGTGTVYDTNGYEGEYLQIQLPEKIKLYSYSISNRPGSAIGGRQPKDAKIFASNDGSTWIDIHTHSDGGGTYDTDGETRTFQLDNITETYYIYYRLVVNSIIQGGSSDTPNTSQWQLFGVPEYDPEAHGTDVIMRSVPNVPNTDWLEVYYDAKDLADGAVTSVDDLTPSGTNDGTATNVTVSDGAFVFNGTDSRISSSITQSAGAYVHTASVWYYTNDDPATLEDYIYQLGNGSTNTSPSIQISNNRLYISFVGNYIYTTTVTRHIQRKKWVQISYTYDGSPVTINNPSVYINGTRITMTDGPAGSQAGSTLSLGTDPQLRVGCSNANGSVVNGSIANFRLFNRALTSDEVWQLYAYQKEYFDVSPDVVTFKGGRLGIGTSEPRAVLDVRGNIYGPMTTFRAYSFKTSYSTSWTSAEGLAETEKTILTQNVTVPDTYTSVSPCTMRVFYMWKWFGETDGQSDGNGVIRTLEPGWRTSITHNSTTYDMNTGKFGSTSLGFYVVSMTAIGYSQDEASSPDMAMIEGNFEINGVSAGDTLTVDLTVVPTNDFWGTVYTNRCVSDIDNDSRERGTTSLVVWLEPIL